MDKPNIYTGIAGVRGSFPMYDAVMHVEPTATGHKFTLDLGGTMLADREFYIEGHEIASARHQDVTLTEGERPSIAKGYFDEEEKPVVTWENGSGECEYKFNSIHHMGQRYTEGTIVRIPPLTDDAGAETDRELCLPLRLPF